MTTAHRSGGGAIVGAGLLAVLYPDAGPAVDDIVTPHTDTTSEANRGVAA